MDKGAEEICEGITGAAEDGAVGVPEEENKALEPEKEEDNTLESEEEDKALESEEEEDKALESEEEEDKALESEEEDGGWKHKSSGIAIAVPLQSTASKSSIVGTVVLYVKTVSFTATKNPSLKTQQVLMIGS